MTKINLDKILNHLEKWSPCGVKEILGRDNSLILFDEVCRLSNLVEAMKNEISFLKSVVDQEQKDSADLVKMLDGLKAEKGSPEPEQEPEKKRQWAEGLFLTINPEIKVKLEAAQKALAEITAKMERGEFEGGDDEQTE